MATKKSKFNGLTDDQVLAIFGRIAVTASLMASMCRAEADRNGEKDVALTFHALDTMLSGVGALADHAMGGEWGGDFAEWMVGPIFNKAQQDGGAA